MKTTLIIARHGNTFQTGETPRRIGLTDLPLVASGQEQAKQLGQNLLAYQLVPDLIFCSQLKRTQETAVLAQAMMGTDLKVKILSQLNEIDYGLDENKTEQEVIQRIGAQTLKKWEKEALVPNGWKVNPKEIIQEWQTLADDLRKNHLGKMCLVITSNGIARFAPYLTGNFKHFKTNYSIKLLTGAFGVFTVEATETNWYCELWNQR